MTNILKYIVWTILLKHTYGFPFHQSRSVRITNCKCLYQFVKEACNGAVATIQESETGCANQRYTEAEIYRKYCVNGTLGTRYQSSVPQREFEGSCSSNCKYIDRCKLEKSLRTIPASGICIAHLRELCGPRKIEFPRVPMMLGVQHARETHRLIRKHSRKNKRKPFPIKIQSTHEPEFSYSPYYSHR